MALKADIAHVPFGNVLTELARNERRRAIRRKILDFRRDQRIHMPGLNNRVHFAADGSLENGAALEPEDIPLYLPSDSGNGAHRDDICDRHLVQLEDRLRVTQADEALDELRRQLRTRTFANRFKIKNFVGQDANAQGRQWQATIDRRAIAAAKRYRRAREALLELRGRGDWENTYQELHDQDVRSFNERVLTEQEQADRAAIRLAVGMPVEGVFGLDFSNDLAVREGRRTMSWIWLAEGGTEDEDNPVYQECKLDRRVTVAGY